MLLSENRAGVAGRKIEIVATDLSEEMLERAAQFDLEFLTAHYDIRLAASRIEKSRNQARRLQVEQATREIDNSATGRRQR